MRFLLGLSLALLCIFPVYASEAPADGYLSDEEIASVVGDDADGGVIYDEDGNVVYVTVTDSNAQVATSFPPSVPVADVLPYVTVVLLMGVILCSMRSRH